MSESEVDTTVLVTTILDEWGAGKYPPFIARIRQYFEGVIVGDLPMLDEDLGIIDAAVPEDKFMMAIFYNRCLRPIIDKLLPYHDERLDISPASPYYIGSKNIHPVIDEKGTLSLVGMITGNIHPVNNDPDQIHIRLLSAKLESTFSADQLKSVLCLDVSNNFLQDHDIIDLEIILVKLLPNCHVLKLNSNKIEGRQYCIERLTKILKFPQIWYVEVMNNYFQSLTSLAGLEEFSKLIWIHQHRFEETHWNMYTPPTPWWWKLLPDATPEQLEEVERIHKQYWRSQQSLDTTWEWAHVEEREMSQDVE